MSRLTERFSPNTLTERGDVASFCLGLHSFLPSRLQAETDEFYLMMAAAEGGNASGGRIGQVSGDLMSAGHSGLTMRYYTDLLALQRASLSADQQLGRLLRFAQERNAAWRKPKVANPNRRGQARLPLGIATREEIFMISSNWICWLKGTCGGHVETTSSPLIYACARCGRRE